MSEHEVLNFFRADLFTAPVDQVFLATFDDVVARWVTPEQVSRLVETIGSERFCVVFGGTEIATQGIRTPDKQFSGCPLRHLVALVVDQPQFIAGRDRPAHGLVAEFIRVIKPYVVEQPLGHTEYFLNLAGRNERLCTTLYLGLELLTPCIDDADRRQVVLLEQRIVQQTDE